MPCRTDFLCSICGNWECGEHCLQKKPKVQQKDLCKCGQDDISHCTVIHNGLLCPNLLGQVVPDHYATSEKACYWISKQRTKGIMVGEVLRVKDSVAGEDLYDRSLNFTGALCDLMTIIDNHDLVKFVDAEVVEWWKKHSVTEEQKIKEEALAKLTEREKRVLGLK